MVDLKKMASFIEVKRYAINLEKELTENIYRLQNKTRYSSYQEYLIDELNVDASMGALESISVHRKRLHNRCDCGTKFNAEKSCCVFYQKPGFSYTECLACGYWLKSFATEEKKDFSNKILLDDYIDFSDSPKDPRMNPKSDELIESIENIIIRLSQDIELISTEELINYIKEELKKDFPKVRKLSDSNEK